MPTRPSGRPLTIGAVLKSVAEEFPEISISKIRFLETEGLLSPTRTPSGYRTYTTDDVGRLLYILRAQRDRFWPLKVIRESLDAIDRGLSVPEDAAAGRPAVPAADENADVPAAATLRPSRSLRLTAAELCHASDISAELLAELDRFGLVTTDASGHYGEGALAVARVAGSLAGRGVEARHLRTFRTAADREIGLIEQILAGERGDVGEQREELLRQCILLHAALVRSGLERQG